MKNYFITLFTSAILLSCTYRQDYNNSTEMRGPDDRISVQRFDCIPVVGTLHQIKLIEGRDTSRFILYENGFGVNMIKY